MKKKKTGFLTQFLSRKKSDEYTDKEDHKLNVDDYFLYDFKSERRETRLVGQVISIEKSLMTFKIAKDLSEPKRDDYEDDKKALYALGPAMFGRYGKIISQGEAAALML
jgi:hypothetical protein